MPLLVAVYGCDIPPEGLFALPYSTLSQWMCCLVDRASKIARVAPFIRTLGP